MRVKKETWIEAAEAASIMTKNSGHAVSTDYVRLLSNQKKIRSRPKDGRTKEYLKTDVENYKVRANSRNKATTEKEKENAA